VVVVVIVVTELPPEPRKHGALLELQDLPEDCIELEQQFDAPPGLLEQLDPPQTPHAESQQAIPSE